MTDSPTDLSLELSEMDALTDAELTELWAKHYGSPPHRCIGRTLLTRAVAYKTQERRAGGNGRSLRKRLKTLSEQLNDRGNIRITGAPPFKPGTRLVREWQGKTYEVTITDGGFTWQGQGYKSLSQVARSITGSHRSGPAFFGLNKSESSGATGEPANG